MLLKVFLLSLQLQKCRRECTVQHASLSVRYVTSGIKRSNRIEKMKPTLNYSFFEIFFTTIFKTFINSVSDFGLSKILLYRNGVLNQSSWAFILKSLAMKPLTIWTIHQLSLDSKIIALLKHTASLWQSSSYCLSFWWFALMISMPLYLT